jgi:hypothetical protein
MSTIFQYSHTPIPWDATPQDLTGIYNLGIFAVETTQRYVYGTRYITWDGRVYKYMNAASVGVSSYSACANTLEAQTSWTAAVAASAGERRITITDATSIGEDVLAGAHLQIYQATIANSTQYFLVGNEAGNGTNFIVYLEFPLPRAVTASDSVELFENPYRSVGGYVGSSNTYAAWVGIPCMTATSGQKFWCQTWGPCICTPGNTTLDDCAADERLAFFKGDGTLAEVDADGVTASKNQIAGYILNAGTGDVAGPEIYLMCST